MSGTCVAGGNADRARIQRAARSLRLSEPIAAVDVIEPGTGPISGWVLEATLAERDHVPAAALSVLSDERLDLRSAEPQGPHYRIVATA